MSPLPITLQEGIISGIEAEVGENGMLRALRPDTLELTYELAVESDDEGTTNGAHPTQENRLSDEPTRSGPGGAVAEDTHGAKGTLGKQENQRENLAKSRTRDDSRTRRTRREVNDEGRLKTSDKLKHVRMAEEVSIEHIPSAWVSDQDEHGSKPDSAETVIHVPAATKGILKDPLELRPNDEEHRARSRLKRPGRGRRRISPTKPEMSGNSPDVWSGTEASMNYPVFNVAVLPAVSMTGLHSLHDNGPFLSVNYTKRYSIYIY